MAPSSPIVIAVMGMTGAGKSTYIKEVTGRNDVPIGHGLSSQTEKVTSYAYNYAGADFELVDTPGFDDSRQNDDVIAKRVLTWLKTMGNKRLSGIIYIRRITDSRMKGTDLANLRMFQKLIGSGWYSNVVFGTSFWSDIDLSEGARREAELCDGAEYWKDIINKGAKVVRIGLDRDRDQRLLLKIAQNDKRLLQAQREMQSGLPKSETSAAQEVQHPGIRATERRLNQRYEAEAAAARQTIAEQQQQASAARRAQQELYEEELRAQREANRQQVAEEQARERQQAEIIRERQQRETQQRRKMEEIQETKRRQEEQRIQHEDEAMERAYARHQCTQTLSGVRVVCNKCKRKIKHREYQFYHCCHCLDKDGHRENYDLCIDCGPHCADEQGHGAMKICGGAKVRRYVRRRE